MWPPPGLDTDGDITRGREKMEATKIRKIQFKSIGNSTLPAPEQLLLQPLLSLWNSQKKGFPVHCFGFFRVILPSGRAGRRIPAGFSGWFLPEEPSDEENPAQEFPGSQNPGNGHEGTDLPRNPWEGTQNLCHGLGTTPPTPSPSHPAPAHQSSTN